MRERLMKFFRLTKREKYLFAEALYYQLMAGVILKIIPFRHIPKAYSRESKRSAISGTESLRAIPQSSPLTSQISHLAASEIRTALLRSSPCVPWQNKCLVRSLAARKMLRRRGIDSKLSLGMGKDRNRSPLAHAWIKAGDFEVVERTGEYTELYTF